MHHQTTNSKKELEDKHQEGLKATRAEAIEQYKVLDEHRAELLAAHEAGIKMYQKSVKDTGFLRDLKRALGQNSSFTVEKEHKSKEKGNDKAISSVSKDQIDQDGTESQGDHSPQA